MLASVGALFHAKGALSLVLALGVTGALVIGSTSNGAATTLLTAPCSSLTLSASPASPQAAGTTVLLTAGATGCGSPQFRYLVWNGTSWTVAQDWTTSPSFSWNTTGVAAGSYLLRAMARDAAMTAIEVQSPDIPYTLTTSGSTSPCTAVALAPSVASPQAIGTTVVWTASATGCTTPQFRFLVWNASTGWTVAQEWSTSASFSWNTTAVAAGSYLVEAWARAGTSGTLQAQSPDIPYTLTTSGSVSPCTAVALAPNPASPQAVGTIVLWTASATGCTTPQFRFLVWFASTGWTVAQEWSTSTTFSWNTTGLAAGSYLVEAWSRAGTSGTLQAQSADIPYTLTTAGSTGPCTSVALAASPASPQVTGTTIVFTATATGCSAPQFRFWLLKSGAWSVVQDWSSSPTFTWNTTGLPAADYSVQVDVRAGSSGAFQATAQLGFTLTTTTTPPPCAEQATARAFQIQRVDTAFAGFHTDLQKLRGLRDRGVLEKADGTLRLIRHAATKAIHATATATCKKDDENDNDDEDDNDGEHNNGEHDNDHRGSSMSINIQDNDDHGRTLGLTFSGDAKAIADQAIAAMQVAFDTAKNAPAKTPKPTPTPRIDNKAKPAQPSKSPDHKGEHGDHD